MVASIRRTLAVAAPVVADWGGSVAAAGDDRDGAGFAQAGAEPVDVVGAVGDQSAERTGSCHQVRGGANVGTTAGVSRRTIGRPSRSAIRWSLVLRPPRICQWPDLATAAPQASPGQLGEEGLDRVEPGARGRR